MIEQVHRLKTEVVSAFLKHRDIVKSGIPLDVANYILQINDASNLNVRYQSISECAKQLQLLYPDLSISTCKNRVFDAINYFNSDCTVTAEAWNMYFSDQQMKLFEVALVAHKFDLAERCLQRAREYRIAAASSNINPDKVRFKPQLVSADMELERMGVKKKGLLGAYRKALDIIDGQDIPATDKARLIADVEAEFGISNADDNEG